MSKPSECYQCGTATGNALCPKCHWPRDEQLATWWDRLRDDYPDDSKALEKACRGALIRHWGRRETLPVACARAYSMHKKTGVPLGKIRHRVFHVTGNAAEFYASTKTRRRPDRDDGEASSLSGSVNVPGDEAADFFGRVADMLDEDT